jgi:hypothetical protein
MLAIVLANHAARELPETTWTLRFQVEDKLFTKTPFPSAAIIWVDLFGISNAVDATRNVLCSRRSGSHCLSDNDDG